jgi:hypothetical protein
MSKKSHPPEAVQDLVKKILEGWGLTRVAKEQRVFGVWEEAVGEQLAQNTRPVAAYQGALTVLVRDSAWLHELQYMKAEIVKKLNRTLGKGVIRELRFRVGSWEDGEQKPGKEEAAGPVELDPAVVAEAEAAVAVIKDARLREQVLRTLLASGRKEMRDKGR